MDLVIKLSSLTFPSSSEDMFGRDAPVFMEIGVGSGGFLGDLADRRPDVNILGVDRAPQSIARTYRRLCDSRALHARLIKADAAFVVRNVIPQSALSRVYVNYPDPWPRRKHYHRRLLQKPFLRLLASRLTSDGQVLVTTDHREYFDLILQNADGIFRPDRSSPSPEVLSTKWARKGLDHFHASFSLRDGAGEEAFEPDIELLDEMYHAVLQGELPDQESFELRTFNHRSGVSVVRDVYHLVDGLGLAFLVHVEEKSLSQEVIIEARKGKNGFVVGLKRFGEPLHTRALGETVRLIAEWLEERGMRIIHRKY